MSLARINSACDEKLNNIALEEAAGKGKELPPLKDESSDEAAFAAPKPHNYYSEFIQSCQYRNDGCIRGIEKWLDDFIEDIYNNQSEDWQHGFDMGEKFSELKALVRRAEGEQA